MTYRIVMWIALIGIVVQATLYNLYAMPRLFRVINNYAEYIEHLEFINDGCYKVKYQLLKDLDSLSPELKSRQYRMRFRVQ